jgi:pilus assembly protein CpaB
MLEEEERLIPITQRDATAFSNNDLVLGEIARRAIPAGKQLTAADFASSGAPIDIRVPEGLRAIAVQVDQITGVGTLIKTGDYVDMVIGLSGEQFPVITINPEDESITVVTGVNNTSVKLLIEGMQVLGTLLPPTAAPAEGSTGDPGTALTGQQEIVILAVTPQQAEQIKFAQMTSNVSLILRAAGDFRDPDTGDVIIPPPSATTGVILRTLVDEYGVLVPELVEAILPSLESPAPEQ